MFTHIPISGNFLRSFCTDLGEGGGRGDYAEGDMGDRTKILYHDKSDINIFDVIEIS